MEQVGEYDIAASRENVWAALNDPAVLSACIPGCQSVEQTQPHAFDAKVKAKIGPVRATFVASLELANLKPPESYTMQGGVKGGVAGFAKGQAQVTLSESPLGTLLSYQVNASVGGKLAQIGSRLVDGAARKMADDFFAAFRDRLEDAGPDSTTSRQGYESSGNGKIWLIAFAVLAIAMLLVI